MPVIQTTETELHKYCSQSQIEDYREEKRQAFRREVEPVAFLPKSRWSVRIERKVAGFIKSKGLGSDGAARLRDYIADEVEGDTAENVSCQLHWLLGEALENLGCDDNGRQYNKAYGDQLADGFLMMTGEEAE